MTAVTAPVYISRGLHRKVKSRAIRERKKLYVLTEELLEKAMKPNGKGKR